MSKAAYARYVDRVLADIEGTEQLADQIGARFERQADSVYFCGGTPTVLEGAQLERIFDAVRRTFDVQRDAEVTVEVAPGIIVHQGVHQDANPENRDEIANVGFIVGDAAVMVVDPGGSEIEGRQLRAAVRARTNLPIRYVVLTHVHPDHIFGAAAFAGSRTAI